jgi:ribosomal protein RSM22 (predicted rRNA methylase)
MILQIPENLQRAMDHQVEGCSLNDLRQAADKISQNYRQADSSGSQAVVSETDALAYMAARMPATLCAAADALQHALALLARRPASLLDIGAGTGAAAWAAASLLDLKSVVLLEKNDLLARLGHELMLDGPPALQQATWLSRDLTDARCGLPEADLVLASYVINEIPVQARSQVIKNIWAAARLMLLIIEPGTPAGFAGLLEMRQALLGLGGHLLAPCPGDKPCPIGSDWCSFSCRVERSRLHRQLKGGTSPFEDEKYSYLALVRNGRDQPGLQRVLRHPEIRQGHVVLKVCEQDGIRQVTVSRKAGEIYKKAQKAEAGDVLTGATGGNP